MKRLLTIVCAGLIGATICGCHSSKHHHSDHHKNDRPTRYEQRHGNKKITKPHFEQPPPPPPGSARR